MRLLGQVLWLSLPVVVAGVLHMVVVKRGLFARLAVPLDGGHTAGGRPIFGPNKTWRGVVVMIAAAALAGAVQGLLGGGWAARAGVEVVDFAAVGGGRAALGYAWVNAVLGLGYVLGELPNSFFKRRLGIRPGLHGGGALGRLFFAFDQFDSVLVALLLGALVFGFGWPVVLLGTLVLAGVHLGVTAALHRGGIKENL